MLKFAFVEYFYHKRWKKDSRLLFNRLLIIFLQIQGYTQRMRRKNDLNT